MRDIPNRMGYRLTRIRKGKPLEKVAATDALFANVQAVKAAAKDDPEVLVHCGNVRLAGLTV